MDCGGGYCLDGVCICHTETCSSSGLGTNGNYPTNTNTGTS